MVSVEDTNRTPVTVLIIGENDHLFGLYFFVHESTLVHLGSQVFCVLDMMRPSIWKNVLQLAVESNRMQTAMFSSFSWSTMQSHHE